MTRTKGRLDYEKKRERERGRVMNERGRVIRERDREGGRLMREREDRREGD